MKSISILGKCYELVETDEKASYGFSGAGNSTKLVICVNNEIPPEQYEDTLLHETVHMIDHELHLGLNEETVARLAVGLYSAGCRVHVNENLPGKAGGNTAGKARTRSAKGAKEI